MTLNATEEFVARICRSTFLNLWSFENPRSRDPRHELCDILIVCDPHVIIISVKERALNHSGDLGQDWERWTRKAVTNSIKQISGAEREIAEMSHVIRSDGSQGLPLPPQATRQIHRIAVAIGGKDCVPIAAGDQGKGFCHVFDETAFELILTELDTITDFTQFLTALEEHLYRTQVIVAGLENLLAVYLENGREFPKEPTIHIIEGEIWSEYLNRPEVRKKKEANRVSYYWDKLIEAFTLEILERGHGNNSNLSDLEPAVRIMALESRFSRRILGKLLAEFLRQNPIRIRARHFTSEAGVSYVFLMTLGNREDRIEELKGRCFIVRGLIGADPVVGIATEAPPNANSPTDLYFLSKAWTDEDQRSLVRIQNETGYFRAPKSQRREFDEYPNEQEE